MTSNQDVIDDSNISNNFSLGEALQSSFFQPKEKPWWVCSSSSSESSDVVVDSATITDTTIITATTYLPFECTACGKCCKTKGSVWMSPPEVHQVSNYFNMSPDTFISTYASNVLLSVNDDYDNDLTASKTTPWVELTNNVNNDEACIFLDKETNHCKVYPVRPVQCSTYPFWPDILASKQSWNDEVRRRGSEEDMDTMNDGTTSASLPYWTPLGGGCEGMGKVDVEDDANGIRYTNPNGNDSIIIPILVTVEEARTKLEAYEFQDRRFPFRGKLIPVNGNRDKRNDENDHDK